jgi:hypothetical protein
VDSLGQLRRRREEILRIAGKHGVLRVRVFGSVAQGEAKDDSDVDFLIERGAKRTFFFPGGLIADLEGLLGRRVDVATVSGLDPDIRDEVLREAVDL